MSDGDNRGLLLPRGLNTWAFSFGSSSNSYSRDNLSTERRLTTEGDGDTVEEEEEQIDDPELGESAGRMHYLDTDDNNTPSEVSPLLQHEQEQQARNSPE